MGFMLLKAPSDLFQRGVEINPKGKEVKKKKR
jgi:hypothetical protein